MRWLLRLALATLAAMLDLSGVCEWLLQSKEEPTKEG